MTVSTNATGHAEFIIDHYSKLMDQHNQFIDALDNDLNNGAFHALLTHTPEKTLNPKLNNNSNHPIINAFNALYYIDGQAPEKTLTFPGACRISLSTHNHAKALNEQRKFFRRAVASIRNHQNIDIDDIFIQALTTNCSISETKRIIKDAFSQSGADRICLKQLTRILPIIGDQQVSKIRYFYKPNCSQRKSTAETLLHALVEDHDQTPAVKYAIDMLSRLAPQTPIALLSYQGAKIIQANACIVDQQGARHWQQRPGVLPILCPSDDIQTPIALDDDALAEGYEKPARGKRTDTRIISEPLCRVSKFAYHLYR